MYIHKKCLGGCGQQQLFASIAHQLRSLLGAKTIHKHLLKVDIIN